MKYIACVGNKTRGASFSGVFCLLLCASLSLFASDANAMSESRGDEVAPGGYIWNPSLASDGTISMRVDLDVQKAYVYRGDTLIGIASIASGKPGYETPDGIYYVLEKERTHHSNKYDNAPMPYMQRLSWSGLALHGGHPHGYAASHGCIRMPMGFAADLFKEDTRGMQVAIEGHARGRGRSLVASRQRMRAPVQSEDLRTTEYSTGQDESGDATMSSGTPASAASGYEQNDVGPYRTTGNRYPAPDDDRSNPADQPAPDRAPDTPPPDLPPPPPG